MRHNKIVAVGEFDGTAYDPAGLDVVALEHHLRARKTIRNFPGAKTLESGAHCLEVDCDILVPAALENQITEENAGRIRARIIGEGANGPITAAASETLYRRGVMVIPDMYLNAGGVTVSYFEWLKNLSHIRFGRMEKRFEERAYRKLLSAVEQLTGKRFSEDELAVFASGPSEEDLVNSGLEETMITSYQRIREMRRRLGDEPDLRISAFVVAIEMICATYGEMGIFP